jgi:hypothetical protein
VLGLSEHETGVWDYRNAKFTHLKVQSQYLADKNNGKHILIFLVIGIIFHSKRKNF